MTLKGLSPTDFDALNSTDLEALNPADIEALSSTDLEALSPTDQIQAIAQWGSSPACFVDKRGSSQMFMFSS